MPKRRKIREPPCPPHPNTLIANHPIPATTPHANSPILPIPRNQPTPKSTAKPNTKHLPHPLAHLSMREKQRNKKCLGIPHEESLVWTYLNPPEAEYGEKDRTHKQQMRCTRAKSKQGTKRWKKAQTKTPKKRDKTPTKRGRKVTSWRHLDRYNQHKQGIPQTEKQGQSQQRKSR